MLTFTSDTIFALIFAQTYTWTLTESIDNVLVWSASWNTENNLTQCKNFRWRKLYIKEEYYKITSCLMSLSFTFKYESSSRQFTMSPFTKRKNTSSSHVWAMIFASCTIHSLAVCTEWSNRWRMTICSDSGNSINGAPITHSPPASHSLLNLTSSWNNSTNIWPVSDTWKFTQTLLNHSMCWD